MPNSVLAKHRRKHLFFTMGLLSVVCVVIGILYIGLQHDMTKLPSTIEGKPAYAFSAEWIQGQEFLPSATSTAFTLNDIKGRPVILNFWASWCVSCRDEALELEAFWQKHRYRDVLVIGIAIQDTQTAALQFARMFGKTYILGLDVSGKASIDYGVTGVPESFFINRQGVVVHKMVGPVTVSTMEKYLPQIM